MVAQPNSGLLDVITSAATQYGVDPNVLISIARTESNFDPMAQNPRSSAGGVFQFLDATADQYGLQDRFDPVQASDAAARLTRDNAVQLRRLLGREPTAAELYLAHQQGATGASKLLTNPNARAVDVVGRQQVLLNGGTEDMTAGEFANMWTNRAGGVPAPQVQSLLPVSQGGAGLGIPVPEAPPVAGGAPMPAQMPLTPEVEAATQQLSRFLPPNLVQSIPADQRAGYAQALRRQMGLTMLAGGNPMQAILGAQENIQQMLGAQQTQQQQQQINQLFSGGSAAGGALGGRGSIQERANQYFQVADALAQQGNIELAQRYHSIGLDLLKEAPAGQIVAGADLGLDPDQTYYVDKDGKPAPLGPVAGENAPVVNTIHNTFQTISRDNRDQLIAADRALKSLESTDDFATSQALLNWLTAIGARPRVGADGNYTTESGIGAEFTRIINLVGGGGQLTEQQRNDLRTQISQAKAPIRERQSALNDVLRAQLEQINVPKSVVDQMIKSIEGSEAPAAPPPPPGTAPAAAAPAAAATGAPITITTDEEYDALPSGTVFVDPNGVTRRKP